MRFYLRPDHLYSVGAGLALEDASYLYQVPICRAR